MYQGKIEFNELLLTIAFKRKGCYRNTYGRINATRKMSQK